MTKGRYGQHGGQYIPETLMNAVIELEEAYEHYKKDTAFNAELSDLLKNYAGRPSLLYYAEKMTRDLGGAKIYLKREDLNHTGSVSYTHLDVYKRQVSAHAATCWRVSRVLRSGDATPFSALTQWSR